MPRKAPSTASFGLNREAIQGGFGCEPDRGTAQLLVGDDRPDEHDAEARTDCELDADTQFQTNHDVSSAARPDHVVRR